jgi:DNA-binding response OmpR family regulator/S1-C subfamily serine protease
MNTLSEKLVIVDPDRASRDFLCVNVQNAGYDVSAFADSHEALDALRDRGAAVLLLNAASPQAGAVSAHESIATIRSSATMDGVRVILITGSKPEDRAAAIDLGADDALSHPWDPGELLARIRAQLRARHAQNELVEKTRIAEEGQHIAHTAFEALAVTEKMANDASSLNRRLRIGVGAVFAVALIMAALYFSFAHNAQRDLQGATASVARLEHGIMRQQDLMAEAHRLREQQQAASAPAPVTPAPEMHASNAAPKAAHAAGDPTENLIRTDVPSVCLLHVSVAFRDKQSGRRLHYAGLNDKGEPLTDSEGNPTLTLDGNGPEVKLDVFGTGFPAGESGRILTNRHVAEPWWNNDELGDITSQGFQAEISSIHAYFPGDPRGFTGEIQDISKDADLATMRIDMQDLKRTPLAIDPSKTAAVAGEPIVLMGYATGLAAILARTDEDTAHQIVTKSGGDISQVLSELARRDLIHPLITQGHIGDVLPDKIVFDAQTTSGGSGGPLFNQQGRVIGVTYAVLTGFGGSNFGIPIRFSQPLLAFAPPHP